MANIKDLAPSLVAAGLDPKEIKKDLRPKSPPKAKEEPSVPPKRIRMVYKNLLRGESAKDAAGHACVTVETAEAIKAEVDAVIASLAALEPVDPETPPEEEAVQQDKPKEEKV